MHRGPSAPPAGALAPAAGGQSGRAAKPAVAAAGAALAGSPGRGRGSRRPGRRQLARRQRRRRGGSGPQPGRQPRAGRRQALARRAGARGPRPCRCGGRGEGAGRSGSGRLPPLQPADRRCAGRILAAPCRRPAALRLPRQQRRLARGRYDGDARNRRARKQAASPRWRCARRRSSAGRCRKAAR